MPVVIALLITASLLVFVAYPLLAGEEASAHLSTLPVDVTPQVDLKNRRLVLYENMRDLEFEYQAGKIAQEDYEALREEYTAHAARLMAASQGLLRTSPEDALIEQEVARRRNRRRQATTDYVCPKCGYENPLPVKFCGECGQKLKSRS